jgi:hypothetical protein
MRAFVASLTTITLFIQGLFGCCWGSAPIVSQGPAKAVCSAPVSCCQSGCDAAKDRDETPNPPCPRPAQCRGVCTYLSPQRTTMDHAPLPLAFDSVINLALSVGSQSASSSRDQAAAIPCEPPLRLHLLKQMLLI